jgi:hypothetical protein
MSEMLPARAHIGWLKKTAKQNFRRERDRGGGGRLADAQLALARRYGFASWRGLLKHVEELQTNDQNISMFLVCVRDGDTQAARAMLASEPGLVHAIGPDLFGRGRPQALHVSIEAQRRNVFDLLLASGADVNGRNEHYDHWSPLMLAFSNNQPDMRDTLLNRGASVGLIEAMLLENDALVMRLLGRGKGFLPKAKPSGSLLAFARTPFAIDRLLALGVSPYEKDLHGLSAVDALSRLGKRGQPLVRHMLMRGIQVEPQECARLDDRETLSRMIGTDTSDLIMDAVVMAAVEAGHHDLVRWLLDRGASPNARSSAASRHTAAHEAAWNGDLRMVAILAGRGADIGARDDKHHETPRGWARLSFSVSRKPECKAVFDFLTDLEPTAEAKRNALARARASTG